MKPLAYFPHPLTGVDPRDLLLLERLEPRATNVVLEIGTGNGSSLIRIGQFVQAMHGADVASGAVERLRRFLPRFNLNRDMDLFVLDFCDATLPMRVKARYDLIFSCDTLEHVPDPSAFFANIHALLKPGGRIFVTFPNERPERAHGITFFDGRNALEAAIRAGGFASHDIKIQTVSLSAWAEKILKAGWKFPRTLYKKSLAARLRHQPATPAPQRFNETAFFSSAERLEPVAPLINAYCWSVMKLMAMVRPVYRASIADEDIWDTQILIEASRPARRPAES